MRWCSAVYRGPEWVASESRGGPRYEIIQIFLLR